MGDPGMTDGLALRSPKRPGAQHQPIEAGGQQDQQPLVLPLAPIDRDADLMRP
jgi:hypothetical protein